MTRIYLFFLCFLCGHALAVPMGEADARHLLERTGFGARQADITEFSRLDRRQAVERLLRTNDKTTVNPPPELPYERPGLLKDLSETEKKRFQRERMEEGVAMRAWWLGEMLHAATPQDAFRERMTLFWHNHFVSSQRKVKSGRLMLQQNALLRQHALGNFSRLLHAVSKDPAMLIYLDNASNRKSSPNENFAREVMELFTLGEGHYSEQDIKEAARAFTGWSFEPSTGEYRWRPMIHDDGEKIILGRRGHFEGDAVLDILLGHASTAEFISRKLWLEFVSTQPDAEEIRRIAASFRSGGYQMVAVLRPLLLTEAFWAQKNRQGLIKSPVDIVIGTPRSEGIEVQETRLLVQAMRQMGQDLFSPPNVRGWPGGEHWINSTTLLARKQFIERLMRRENLPAQAKERLQSSSFQLK